MLKENFLTRASEKPEIQISIIKTPSERWNFQPKCSASSYFSGNPSRNIRQPFLLTEILPEMFGDKLFFKKSLSNISAASSGEITACRNVRLPVQDAGRLSQMIFFSEYQYLNFNFYEYS
jgi:hypothetical protein